MKKNAWMIGLLLLAFTVKAQDTTKKIRVAVLLYPGVELIDFAGPTDVFIKANQMTRGKYEVYSVAFGKGPVQTQGGGPMLLPSFDIASMPRPDILVIPGAAMETIDSLRKNQKYIGFIKKYSGTASVTMSVCTGAYFLGSAGLLDDRKATTHYFMADDLKEQFPSITLAKNVRYVDADSIVTASGVSSGIDAAIHVVRRLSGDMTAEMVCRALQYTPNDSTSAWPVAFKGMKFDREHPMGGKVISGMKDPVCGMTGNREHTAVYKGKTYYFCSENCKKNFNRNPADYAD